VERIVTVSDFVWKDSNLDRKTCRKWIFFCVDRKVFFPKHCISKIIHIVALYLFERTFISTNILEFLESILNLKYILLKSPFLPNCLIIMWTKVVYFWNFKKHVFLLCTITTFSYTCVASHQKHDIRSSNQRIKTNTPMAMLLERIQMHWPHLCGLRIPTSQHQEWRQKKH
jgi:hypothetical protein